MNPSIEFDGPALGERVFREVDAELFIFCPSGRGAQPAGGGGVTVLDGAGADEVLGHVEWMDGLDCLPFVSLPEPPAPGVWRVEVTCRLSGSGEVVDGGAVYMERADCPVVP